VVLSQLNTMLSKELWSLGCLIPAFYRAWLWEHSGTFHDYTDHWSKVRLKKVSWLLSLSAFQSTLKALSAPPRESQRDFLLTAFFSYEGTS
jgi:hypothetical protein